MQPRIRVIPPTLNRFTSAPTYSVQKRRVAGYARVSTDLEQQQSSYENQIDYYTNYIKSRSDWEFAGLYTDEGISATSTKHREGFKRMIGDALAGKIDLIVTKSISRFARNTVDSLTMIRKLKEKGVEVFFEKENIWTFDSKGELLITIMSSLAQEESRSISENTTWGRRKSFADGKVSVGYSAFLGYDKDFAINDEQAETVRLIYKLFLSGLSYNAVCKELEKLGRLTATGQKRWHACAVRSVLTNEKYKGDALLQKRYTVDFLTKKMKKNDGEVQMYFIEGHHAPIVSPVLFDMVQKEIERRKKVNINYYGKSLFPGKIICGECGHFYGAKTWHSTGKNRKTVYTCNGRYQYKTGCRTRHLNESEIKQLFVESLESIVKEKRSILGAIKKTSENMIAYVKEAKKEIESMSPRIEELQNTLLRMIEQNSHMALQQSDYQQRYDALYKELEQLKKREIELDIMIKKNSEEIEKLETFTGLLKNMKANGVEFKKELWDMLVEKGIVATDGKVTLYFVGGIEVTV